MIIAHIIGTTTLILIFMSVTMYYSMLYFSLQDTALSNQLQEAADYVSSVFTDLVSLSYTASVDQLIVKKMDLPQYISDNPYNVTILSRTDPDTLDTILFVQVFFTLKPSNSRESLLPWSKATLWNGTYIPERITPKIMISSGFREVVGWALRENMNVTIGLGVLD